jgi:ribosomal protein S27E
MITTVGLSFDHGDVKRFDMDCISCHEGVVRGTGEVPPERCYTCHNNPARLGRSQESEFLHQMHVTEHKVECLHCHIEIVHAIPPREEALATACQTCHSSAAGHSLVRDLYRGIGGQGVEPQPAAMFLAGVRCEACHNTLHTESSRATEVGCMSCHGPRYLTIYRSWKVGLARRLEGVKAELFKVRRRVEERDGTADLSRLEKAEHNVALVEQGKGMHNPQYALHLLERAHEDGVATLAALGEPGLPSRPWVQARYDSECLECHFGVEYLSRPAFGRDFPHQTHVAVAGLRCTVCHTGTDDHGRTKIGAADCERCHTMIAKPMGELAADECLTCHTAEIGTVSEMVNFPHEKHIEFGFGCELCHAGVTDQRHLKFARSSGAVPELGHEFCVTCHASDVPSAEGVMPDGADCTKCHVAF